MDEQLDYLKSVKFAKQLPKLAKKLKGKTVIIYGAGILFQKIAKNFDLSGLNIIGISDRKYGPKDAGKEVLGYKIIPLDNIKSANPDYVLVATLKFLSIIDDFQHNTFKGTKIKVLPLVDKPFFTLLKEIFE